MRKLILLILFELLVLAAVLLATRPGCAQHEGACAGPPEPVAKSTGRDG